MTRIKPANKLGRNKLPIKNYDWKKFEKNNVTIALNVLHA